MLNFYCFEIFTREDFITGWDFVSVIIYFTPALIILISVMKLEFLANFISVFTVTTNWRNTNKTFLWLVVLLLVSLVGSTQKNGGSFIAAYICLCMEVWNCWETVICIDTLSSGSKDDLKPPLHVETFSWNLCAKALRNKFQQALHRVTWSVSLTFVARQVSRKVEPLSTSATARNGRSGEKKKQGFHRVTPLSETGLVRRCTQDSAKIFNV